MPTCRCKNRPTIERVSIRTLPLYALWFLEVWFMINFASCFMIDKAHWWRTFPKCEARLSHCHVLGPLFCECPHPEALSYTKGLVTLGGGPSFLFCPNFVERVWTIEIASFFITSLYFMSTSITKKLALCRWYIGCAQCGHNCSPKVHSFSTIFHQYQRCFLNGSLLSFYFFHRCCYRVQLLTSIASSVLHQFFFEFFCLIGIVFIFHRL
jgi:hypothetical protein